MDEALEMLMALGPEAAGVIGDLLDDEKTSYGVKLKLSEMLLKHMYGNPKQRMKMKVNMKGAVEAAQADLAEMLCMEIIPPLGILRVVRKCLELHEEGNH